MADVVRDVKVEAVFDDGTRLVVVPEPFGPASSTLRSPGAVLAADAAGHPGRPDLVGLTDLVDVVVVNEAPVPISVTSHFHFFEVNPRLRFDRAAACGAPARRTGRRRRALRPGC